MWQELADRLAQNFRIVHKAKFKIKNSTSSVCSRLYGIQKFLINHGISFSCRKSVLLHKYQHTQVKIPDSFQIAPTSGNFKSYVYKGSITFKSIYESASNDRFLSPYVDPALNTELLKIGPNFVNV